jgi:NADP-dependent 3-hydroxy acid dehydrogenase YdfG
MAGALWCFSQNPLLAMHCAHALRQVTGASSGIGEAIAKALAAAGASVCCAARRTDRIEALAAALQREHGVGAVGIATDVTRREDVKECVKRAEVALGLPVCILVNCAGVMHYTRMSQLLEDQWAQEVSVNCMGVLNGIGAVLQGMIERKRGHIINMCGSMPRPNRPFLLTLFTGQNI